MKSYLRHSKDRRVRGSANGASTVCVFPGRHKKIKIKIKKDLSTNRRLFKITTKIIERGGKKKEKHETFPSLYLPRTWGSLPFLARGRNGSTRVNCTVIIFRRKGARPRGEPLFLGGPACAGCAHSLCPRTPG